MTHASEWRTVATPLQVAAHKIAYKRLGDEFDGDRAVLGCGGDPPLEEQLGKLAISNIGLTTVQTAVRELTRHMADHEVLDERLDMRGVLGMDMEH